jgi:hypothetical protein
MAAGIVAVVLVGARSSAACCPAGPSTSRSPRAGIVPAVVEVVPGEKVTFVLDADARTSFHLSSTSSTSR